MRLVIDIPDGYETKYKSINNGSIAARVILNCVSNGTPLPKDCGRLIDADKCVKQAWNDFYKHEDEWEKKDPDYVGVKRLHDQNGFECCLKTICESPTVIESEEV